MGERFSFWGQDFFLGGRKFEGGVGELKGVVLCGQVAMSVMTVTAIYIVIDLTNTHSGFTPFFVGAICFGGVVIMLLRRGLFLPAKILLLSSVNAVIFLVACHSPEQGIYYYMVLNIILALAVFGRRQLSLAIVFSLLSMSLFFVAHYWPVKIPYLAERTELIFSPEFTQFLFQTHFVVGCVACFYITFVLLDLNQRSEQMILAKNEELSKANGALDRFVYHAAHDLRSPLHSIRGLIDLAGKTDDLNVTKDYLQMMGVSAHNLNAFITELIDYSKNSGMVIAAEPVNVRDMTQDVCRALQFMDGYDQVTFALEMPADLVVQWDKSRVRSVLSNLIGNAIKYRDTLKNQCRVSIAAARKGPIILYTIRDNGLGIAKEHQEKICKIFYRVPSAVGGSGLGLFIVKETIEQLRGTIYLESEVGQGSEFIVRLPG